VWFTVKSGRYESAARSDGDRAEAVLQVMRGGVEIKALKFNVRCRTIILTCLISTMDQWQKTVKRVETTEPIEDWVSI